MKRPNKKHRAFIKHILGENDADIIKHRLCHLPQVTDAYISHGWTSYASFTLSNGKTFRGRWGATGEEQAYKDIFKQMLAYWRKTRNNAINKEKRG